MSINLDKDALSKTYNYMKSKKVSELGDKNLPEDKIASLRLIHRSVNSCTSESEWLNYIFNNELPPIKLAPEEMEMVKGGAIPFIVAFVGYIVVDAILTEREAK